MQATKLLGGSPLTTSHAYTCGFLSLPAVQSVRWRVRKPFWLPTAKTKIFRVPVRPKIPQDEYAEISRLYNNYRTYLRSTLAYFKEINKQNEVQLEKSVIDKAEDEDFEQCFKINEEWNKEIAAARQIRLENKAELTRLKILEKIEREDKIKEMLLLKADKEVNLLKTIAPTLITRDNIDQAIEEALANVINYNKALDINGEWYTDTTGLPPPKESKTVQPKQ